MEITCPKCGNKIVVDEMEIAFWKNKNRFKKSDLVLICPFCRTPININDLQHISAYSSLNEVINSDKDVMMFSYCPFCGYFWRLRTWRVKECPRCKRRLDRF